MTEGEQNIVISLIGIVFVIIGAVVVGNVYGASIGIAVFLLAFLYHKKKDTKNGKARKLIDIQYICNDIR